MSILGFMIIRILFLVKKNQKNVWKMSEIDIGGKSNTSRCKMFCIIACSRCDKILKSIWPLEKSLELSSISDVDGISS